MIIFSTNKKDLALITRGVPLLNFPGSAFLRVRFSNLMLKIISWHQNCNLSVDINNLTNKTRNFTTLMSQAPLGYKILGSGNYKTAIWLLYINQTPYIFYLSKRGLSIETIRENGLLKIYQDMKEWAKTYLK